VRLEILHEAIVDKAGKAGKGPISESRPLLKECAGNGSASGLAFFS